MAIRGNLSIPPTAVQLSDTVVFNASGLSGRYNISAFNVFNNSGGNAIFEVYVSPDTASVSGDMVAKYGVPNEMDIDVLAMIGQSYEGLNIIMKCDSVGCIATMTYTEYSGSD